MGIKKLWNKVANYVAPVEESEEILFENELQHTKKPVLNMSVNEHTEEQQAKVAEERKVVDGTDYAAPKAAARAAAVSTATVSGSTFGTSAAATNGNSFASPTSADSNYVGSTRLKLHSNESKKLKVQVYIMSCYDNVAEVADALRSGRAAVVNYEKVSSEEQRRICDFMNGVAYVLDGSVRRVTEELVLYVPAGVSVDARLAAH